MIHMAAIDHIALDLHILVSKLCRSCIVGVNAANLCRRQYDHIRLLRLKELPDCLLVCQIKLSVRTSYDIAVTLFLQIPHNRTSYQSSVSCHINFVCLVHD